MKSVPFVIENDNNYYRFELGSTLLKFTEYDFTFFWETCINAGRTAYKEGMLPKPALESARISVSACHPYVAACQNGSFDSVALDCIIAYICSSEHISLNDLWERCITPKNYYEAALFRRISEYKTGRAINQWVNIVRMKEYARTKLAFIYDNRQGEDISPEMLRTRREYFDLAFAVASNDLGYTADDLPYVRKYNPALLPGSPFRMSRISRSIYSDIGEKLRNVESDGDRGHNRVSADRHAMDVFSLIKNIKRPDDKDLVLIRDAINENDEWIYMPNGFKGIIDLEFDLMAENNMVIKRCENCGKFFVFDKKEYPRPFCRRLTPSGKTCREEDEEKVLEQRRAEEEEKARIAAEIAAATTVLEKEPEYVTVTEKPDFVDGEFTEAPTESVQTTVTEETREDTPQTQTETEIPIELIRRAERIYEAFGRYVGNEITETEYREWTSYLESLETDARNGRIPLYQLSEFLDSSDRRLYALRVYGTAFSDYTEEAPAQSNKPTETIEKEPDISPIPKYDGQETRERNTESTSHSSRIRNVDAKKFEPERFDSSAVKESPHLVLSEVELLAAAVNAGWTGGQSYIDVPQPDIPSAAVPTESVTDDGREYKPFAPKKYSSLYDAMMDAPTRSKENSRAKAATGRVIRMPEWEKLSKK